MEQLLDLLREINPDIDYENVNNLIDGHLLDSLSILIMISKICTTFDIVISPKWMKNENFNSVKAMWNMIQCIQDEE